MSRRPGGDIRGVFAAGRRPINLEKPEITGFPATPKGVIANI